MEKGGTLRMELLVVVDMQKDFIDGALGTPEACAIVDAVVKEIEEFSGEVVYTMDTHDKEYLTTQEGANLPVLHCIRETEGWQLEERMKALAIKNQSKIFEKPGFGSMELANYVMALDKEKELSRVVLVGLCTDICVISNAMLIKAAVPEVKIEVKESCLAGVSIESHKNALEAMKMCQIKVV